MSGHAQVLPSPTVPSESSRRILSLDAARGYATCLMVFGPVFHVMQSFSHPVIRTIGEQSATHAAWHGIHFFDFGFPFYLQVVGISIAISLPRRLEQVGKRRIYAQVLRRTVLLLALGFIYNGGFGTEWPGIRLAGILQRIAICYFLGVIVFIHLRPRSQVVLLVAILLGYWAMLAWFPIPTDGGRFTFKGNLAAYVDHRFLPGRKLFGTWDPEGLLTTLPAFATCLTGIMTGRFLRDFKGGPQQTVFSLALAGAACTAIAVLWSEWLPFNKKMWTSSYVLVSAGNTLFTLAFFYQIGDVWQKQKWLFPLTIVGVNTLVAFLAMRFLPLHDIALRLVGGDIQAALGALGPLVVAATEVFLCWLLLYWLYRCDIVLKA